jgi:two-component system phosphate regulon sensor histidine kinase PhoR
MLRKIFTLLAAVLLIAIIINGLFSFQIIKTYGNQANYEYLKAAAIQATRQLESGISAKDVSVESGAIFQRENLPVRLTLIDRAGQVLFDNSADIATLDNHLQRPEIAAALTEAGIGTSIRYSTSIGAETLYLARYSENLELIVRTSMPIRSYQAGLIRIAWTIAIVFAGAVFILILMGVSFLRNIIQPLQQLESATSAMAAGDYSIRVQKMLKDDSEVAVLARSFNLMAKRLQVTVADLGDKNARLDAILDSMTDPLMAVSKSTAVTFMNSHARKEFGHDLDPEETVYPLFYITHLHALDQLVASAIAKGAPVSDEVTIMTVHGPIRYTVIASPIRSAISDGAILTFHDISELRKAQKIRSDFVANVTHELKTPLTSIRGFIETLRQGAINKPDVSGRFLDIIDIEAERLHKLISDILILSEIEDLKKERDAETFNLRELIDDVVVLLDDTASSKKVSLITDDEEKPLLVTANRFRVKQVLINLVDNAIKYNRENGRVFINATRDEQNRLVLRVRDTGVGIASEHQDRIFERFYRVDRSRSRELGSTGLGLSIVKHIAQLYGGHATVRSEPGVGSEFTVLMDI